MTFRTSFFFTSLLACAALAGCGDDGGSTPQDARAIDAPIVDAPACATAGYPETVRALTAELMQESQLTLAGPGTRCDQIVRALLGPNRPPELAAMDATGFTGTCSHDDQLNREIVRLRGGAYGGLPIYWPVQDALVHVDAADKVVFLRGDFLPAGHTVAPACLDASALAARIPGRPLAYEKFALCAPRGDGMYSIMGDDVIEPGDEGLYLDAGGGLRRVRAIDVYLAPAHVNAEIINSDAFCCSGATTDHCVGKRLFLDALTGETIAQEPHCHTC